MFEWIAIRYLMWNLKRQNINNTEYVIRSDGHTCYKRNKEREKIIAKTLDKIK